MGTGFGPNVHKCKDGVKVYPESKERIRNKFLELSGKDTAESEKPMLFAKYLKTVERMTRPGNVIINLLENNDLGLEQLLLLGKSDLIKVRNSGHVTADILTEIFGHIADGMGIKGTGHSQINPSKRTYDEMAKREKSFLRKSKESMHHSTFSKLLRCI
ncbi:MAG: hypothetical protein ACREBH_00385 [Candidatus Micrarchaeaceae archaeon]